MRLALLCLFLLAAVPVWAGDAAPPASATNLVRLHPGPWRLPSLGPLHGMRFDPETGVAIVETAAAPRRDGAGFDVSDAAARARVEAGVQRLPDGSRHAVLAGAIRHWMVVTTDAEGRLQPDCVPSGAAALERIGVPAQPKVHR